jgi:4-hydroxy-3-methylbut-2-en-1-yl diphosphate reductase
MGRPAVVLAPLRLEARAVAAGAPDLEVHRTGLGADAAARAAVNLAARCAGAPAVAVVGFGGGLDEDLTAGEVVVASEVRGSLGSRPVPGSAVLAGALRRAGVPARCGPVLSVDHLVGPAEARRLSGDGTLAVDMESRWLVEAAAGRPLAVLRAVVDTPSAPLRSPGTVTGGVLAYRALRRAAPVLAQWAAAAGPRRVVLAAPRSFCAGVDRAVEIVERALARFGAPVYVRRQIVHNRHVVEELERRGAVFVDELDDVPDGATVVFSAHGVSPAVRARADGRGLKVIDATCPLVAKVHAEARRFARQGYRLVLIGHAGHDETEGTLGEVPGIALVEDEDDVAAITVDDPDRVAYLTQTTLALDEVSGVVAALRARFPALAGQAAEDVCYATQNRQDAVRALARDCDAVLVAGSANSSNSNRLVEVAERAGCRARLVDDESDLDLAWLAGAGTVGISAGASTPNAVVDRLVAALAALGPVDVTERRVTDEALRFALPKELR